MCGRYTIREAELIYAALGLDGSSEGGNFTVRYNVAPSQDVPMVYLKDGKRTIAHASWGFVPSWSKGTPKTKPINARSETVVFESPMFRGAFKTSRCLIPADGFYEWLPTKPKQPIFFHRPDDSVFFFAGLWSERQGQKTCLHITAPSNHFVQPVHDRMPVILDDFNYDRWLDPATDLADLQELLKPDDRQLVLTPVSTRVNTPKFDDAGLVEPVQLSAEAKAMLDANKLPPESDMMF